MNISEILFQTLGGLGLFILGMKMMTEGLQAVVGQKIRGILEALSSNRFFGCLTGAGVTAMIQSSSATTVMLIGFVSAGIISLENAVGVVIGANVGTTITGQMIAFKLTKVALPAIALGVVLKYFSKKRNYRHIGDVILGFGLLFFGMTVMKQGLDPIKTDPQFISFFTTFSTDSMVGILLCVTMGALLTVMVQSSSATVGLTMTLATSGLLTFPTAMALVLGENIGTTITAQLATIGSKNLEAHQTANAHTVFNLVGVGIILIIFPFFVNMVEALSLHFGAGPMDQLVGGEYVNAARYIANGHTLFNVINAILFLILLPRLVQLTIAISPQKKEKLERYQLPEFDARFMDSSIGALARVKGEIIRMANFAHMALEKTSSCLKMRDDDILGERDAIEAHLDSFQKVIIKYLITISQGEINAPESKEISEMMRITNNIERLGDSMENVSQTLEKMYNQGLQFSEDAIRDLVEISNEVVLFLDFVIREMNEKTEDFYQKVLAQEDLIDQMREKMREKHIKRLQISRCYVDTGVLFVALISYYEKMGDYCYNIAIGVNRIL